MEHFTRVQPMYTPAYASRDPVSLISVRRSNLPSVVAIATTIWLGRP